MDLMDECENNKLSKTILKESSDDKKNEKGTYNKSWKSLDQQIEILKNRGLAISDNELAKEHLARIGYYRLSAYLHPFKDTLKGNDVFKNGTKFDNALDLYIFDKKLRLLVLDALEHIEIALRVDVAYLLGEKDPFAQMNPSLFRKDFIKTNKKIMVFQDIRNGLKSTISKLPDLDLPLLSIIKRNMICRCQYGLHVKFGILVLCLYYLME